MDKILLKFIQMMVGANTLEDYSGNYTFTYFASTQGAFLFLDA